MKNVIVLAFLALVSLHLCAMESTDNQDFLAEKIAILTISSTESVTIPPLHQAIIKSDEKRVQEILNQNQQTVNEVFESLTPLQRACAQSNIEILKMLFKAGAKTQINNPAKIRYIDGNGNLVTCDELYPLHIAALSGNRAIVELLLKSGADSTQKDKYGMNALHHATLKGDLKIMDVLINQACISPFLQDSNRLNSIDYILLTKDRAFIDAFASMRYSTTTILHALAGSDHTHILSHLLSTSNVNHRDAEKLTPLHHACKHNKLDNIRLLLQKGADIDALDDQDNTALHYAVGHRLLPVVQILLEHGANLNIMNNQDLSPRNIPTSAEIIQLIRQHDMMLKQLHVQNADKSTGEPVSNDGWFSSCTIS